MVADVADAAVGYPAETTFSTTFKRVMGQPPARYRDRAGSPRRGKSPRRGISGWTGWRAGPAII